MEENNSIVFLHLSDFHIRNNQDINIQHIKKIVESLKCYKSINIKHIIIILSGDLTQSGEETQFKSVYKLMGTLISSLRKTFKNLIYHILVVPGNHDVEHHKNYLKIDELKQNNYLGIESQENSKLKSFYNFSKTNNCFDNKDIYYNEKIIKIDEFNIKVNLINNAIFSTKDEYKGLLYFPANKIAELSKIQNANLVITVMHHSPDFYRDEIKNQIEKEVIANSNILFYGHEHNSSYKSTTYEESNKVFIQLCGSLCKDGNWENSSYIVGIFNIKNNNYSSQKFLWNNNSKQYEHYDFTSKFHVQNQPNSLLTITKEFREELFDPSQKDYFVFPSVVLHSQTPDNDKLFDTFDSFLSELFNHKKSIISGSSNLGKTTLLKKIFDKLTERNIVLFCSPEIMLSKGKNKRQQIDKFIKDLFVDIYGDSDSVWQRFEQYDKTNCIFIFDDFDRVDDFNSYEFIEALSKHFGTIILSTNQTIDFNPQSWLKDKDNKSAKFEIKPLIGKKRKELIVEIVKQNATDKSEKNIETISNQINNTIKSQIKIMPFEPYFIIQLSENFIKNIGEASDNGTAIFSKVFEANITTKIDAILKQKSTDITVELIYDLLGKIAHYIHFNKAYPIKRNQIDNIIRERNEVFGDDLITEDIISLLKRSKILVACDDSETYRFENKNILAYFVAKEIIARKNMDEVNEIINKSCINICTDILLFIIFQTDDISILKNILDFINVTISNDINWKELNFKNNIPDFLKNYNPIVKSPSLNISKDKKDLEQSEEKYEEDIYTEINIKDIYDWDDSIIDEYINKVIRMSSLLHILSKSFPSFQHKLTIEEKKQLIDCLYRLPNMIFMFWAKTIDDSYDNFISELKLRPYLIKNKQSNVSESELDKKARTIISQSALNILLNLYYVPAYNATEKSTYKFLKSKDFFDFSSESTYQLEHLFILEQMYDNNNEFSNEAIKLKKDISGNIAKSILQWIVWHRLITKNDNMKVRERLEDTFYKDSKKEVAIKRAKIDFS